MILRCQSNYWASIFCSRIKNWLPFASGFFPKLPKIMSKILNFHEDFQIILIFCIWVTYFADKVFSDICEIFYKRICKKELALKNKKFLKTRCEMSWTCCFENLVPHVFLFPFTVVHTKYLLSVWLLRHQWIYPTSLLTLRCLFPKFHWLQEWWCHWQSLCVSVWWCQLKWKCHSLTLIKPYIMQVQKIDSEKVVSKVDKKGASCSSCLLSSWVRPS